MLPQLMDWWWINKILGFGGIAWILEKLGLTITIVMSAFDLITGFNTAIMGAYEYLNLLM